MCTAGPFARGSLTVGTAIHDSQKIVMHTIGAVAVSRYKALVDSLAADIRSGRLTAGTRLPTHRSSPPVRASRS